MVFAEMYPVIITRITRAGPVANLAPTGEMSLGLPQAVQAWGTPSQEHH